jgi:hypothetical protein
MIMGLYRLIAHADELDDNPEEKMEEKAAVSNDAVGDEQKTPDEEAATASNEEPQVAKSLKCDEYVLLLRQMKLKVLFKFYFIITIYYIFNFSLIQGNAHSTKNSNCLL